MADPDRRMTDAAANTFASPPGAAARSERNELIRHTVAGMVRTCDAVFGVVCCTLAAIGIFVYLEGDAPLSAVIGLLVFPAFNLIWSKLGGGHNPVRWELLRGAISLPLAVWLYVAERGILEQLWIPSLIMTIGGPLSLGIATRRATLGWLVTLAYVGALLAAISWTATLEVEVIHDLLGILVTGCVVAMVASQLGRALDQVRQQRDEVRQQRDAAREQKDRAEALLLQLTERSDQLTLAIDKLHGEMAHRMRIEIELRQAQKLESVGRLASGVAHEINTPVQFVSNSIQFARDGVAELFGVVDKLEAVQRSVLDGVPARIAAEQAADAAGSIDLPYLAEHVPKALDRALDGLSRVATIVRSMKVFAHPDNRELVAADLNQAIDSTLTMARSEYVDIAELETEFGELPPVPCYVSELNQAVLNIVVNAAHAIGKRVEGTTGKGWLRVRTYREDDEAVIAIADSGGGIPAEVRDRIFDPFFTTKPVGVGTGQGLAISRSVVVDKHRGKLEFETEFGKGTTFFIRLPLDAPPIAASQPTA
jgi:signal transduction histidine kinase